MNRKNILRMVLVVSLVYYLPWAWSFPAAEGFHGHRKAVPAKILENENGMGGSLSPEQSIFVINEGAAGDLTLSGVPEPAEYSKPRVLLYSSYKVESGDNIGSIAMRVGLNQDTLFSVNKITNDRNVREGSFLRIPNQDGILHTVKKGETLSSIAQKYEADIPAIQTANELFSDTVKVNTSLFIPGARMAWEERQEIVGMYFIWPVSGRLTSFYGYRRNPFGGNRQFHNGLDIAAPMGTPVKAAMSGRITNVGYDIILGNFVVITHQSGYRTLYGHMSKVGIGIKPGVQVRSGDRVGYVGTTGISTGPHLHFTVYKNGVTVNPRTMLK